MGLIKTVIAILDEYRQLIESDEKLKENLDITPIIRIKNLIQQLQTL